MTSRVYASLKLAEYFSFNYCVRMIYLYAVIRRSGIAYS